MCFVGKKIRDSLCLRAPVVNSPEKTPQPPPPPRLSTELAAIRQRLVAGGGAVTLDDVIHTLRGRAYTLLLILLALPFTTPIPLPGLSTPFGVAIGIIAFRLTLGMRPWLPARLRRRPLPPGFYGRLFALTGRVLGFLEKFLRPRLTSLTDPEPWRRAHALLILAAAAFLLLPLPIPFSNTFPAWVILLAAGGLLERDGKAILCAYAVALAGVLFFVFLGGAAQAGAEALFNFFSQRPPEPGS